MPPKDFKERPITISVLITTLKAILEMEGDIPVCTHNNPYFDNQWAFPIDEFDVEENPEAMEGVVRKGNPKHAYKGKVLFID